MAKPDDKIKEKIKTLSREVLEKLVIKAASNDKVFFDYLLVNYIDREEGEKELYRQAISDLDSLFYKSYKGFSPQLRMANMLSACIKRINEFSKICKNKNLEADLIIYVLEVPFSNSKQMLGTCFTACDYKTGLLVKRLLTLVTKKLHEDYLADYKAKINGYLSILRSTSDHINFIYDMPKMID